MGKLLTIQKVQNMYLLISILTNFQILMKQYVEQNKIFKNCVQL